MADAKLAMFANTCKMQLLHKVPDCRTSMQLEIHETNERQNRQELQVHQTGSMDIKRFFKIYNTTDIYPMCTT